MKRREGESFEDYKKRRLDVQSDIKDYLQGKWLWRSRTKIGVKEEHNLGTFRKQKEN